MANPRRAATIRPTLASMATDFGPSVEHYNTPLDAPALYRWVPGATDTIDNVTVVGNQGGTGGRWRRVRMPIKGANLTDADETIQVGGNFLRVLPAATLSNNRTLTVGIVNAAAGDVITVKREDTTAYSYTIVNGGPAAGTLVALPRDVKAWADLYFDGANWIVMRASTVGDYNNDSIVYAATWYVSSTGNDKNDGLTVATPLASLGEFFRRMNGRVAKVAMTVNITGDLSEDGLVLAGAFPFSLTIRGQRTVIRSGTISAVQSWDGSLFLDGQIEDSSIPVSWTASGLVRKMMVLTSGPNSGAVAHLTKDLGAKTVRHVPFSKVLEFSRVNPSPLDTYDVVRFTSVSLGPNTGLHDGGASGIVYVHDVEFSFPGSFVTGASVGSSALLAFVTCKFSCDDSTSPVFISGGASLTAFYHCDLSFGSQICVQSGGSVGAYYSLFSEDIWSYNGAQCEVGDVVVEASSHTDVKVSGGGRFVVAPGMWFTLFDKDAVPTHQVFSIESNGCLRIYGKVFGHGNSGYGLRVSAGGSVIYDKGTDFADVFQVTTSDVEVICGGTETTYAAIGTSGVVNASNLAMVVPEET